MNSFAWPHTLHKVIYIFEYFDHYEQNQLYHQLNQLRIY